ncbi:5984_t:CDS:1, partial [Ambispora leptoticha]
NILNETIQVDTMLKEKDNDTASTDVCILIEEEKRKDTSDETDMPSETIVEATYDM